MFSDDSEGKIENISGEENKELDQEKSNRSVSAGFHIEEVRNSPLPSPFTLEQYKKINPGLEKIVIERFIKEQDFRHRQDEYESKQSVAITKLSILSRFVLQFLLITGILATVFFGAQDFFDWVFWLLVIIMAPFVIGELAKLIKIFTSRKDPDKTD